MLVSLALDFVSGSMGAKYFGATRWGAIGGILGAVVGHFLRLPWALRRTAGGRVAGGIARRAGPAARGTLDLGHLPRDRRRDGGEFAIGLLMIGWFLVATLA